MVDYYIIAFAIFAFLAFARRPRPAHPATALVLALITAAWLWANLRSAGWEEFGGEPPVELDPVTRAMFWRGWPLAPCLSCLFHGMRFHPSGFEPGMLIFDWVVLFLALALAGFACERWLRRRVGRAPTADASLTPEDVQARGAND